MTKPEDDIAKFDLRSEDVAEVRRQELLRIFPEAHTESGGINFEALRLSLGDAVQTGPEGFGMSWPGKAECVKTIQRQSIATLLPVEEESVNWDTTQNVIIEGDNLEVLKVLQKAYLGKVKMIYIDPPYNTGNDFIYPDNYTESIKTYLQFTGQVDNEGRKFSTNTESSGRFHSKWMNMMYPRLSLARDLLRDDGVIFVSIDDNELVNLRRICDEVFGEDSHVTTLTWRKRTAKADVPFGVSTDTEYVVVYAGPTYSASRVIERKYHESLDYPGRPWRLSDLTTQKTIQERPNSNFTLVNPVNGEEFPVNPNRSWAITKDTFQHYYDRGKIVFPGTYDFLRIAKPAMRIFQDEERNAEGKASVSNWLPHETIGRTEDGTKELTELMGGKVFPFPKPTSLIRYLLENFGSREGLVLDFFGGSGTTAQSVMQLNSEDSGDRQFMLVQLPESVADNSDAKQAGFATITEVTRQRIRLAGKQLLEKPVGLLDEESALDVGFRSFRLSESNFAVWDANAIEGDEMKLEQQLFAQVEHVMPGRTNQDVLFELMLKSRYALTTSVEQLKVGKCEVWKVAGDEMVAVIDSGLTIEVIREIAGWKPISVVILDRCFGADDSLKANARKIFEDSKVDLKTV